MSVIDSIFGSERQHYDPNSAAAKAASSMGGANGSTSLLSQAAGGALGRQTPTIQGPNMGNYNQDRAQQQGYVSMLSQAANGHGPSAAQLAGQQSRDAALSQAAALQAGRRGQSGAQSALIGSMASSQGIQQANAQQAQGQAAEMAMARGQEGAALSGLAGQDIGVAGLQQQTALANQSAELQQQGINNSLFLGSNAQLQNQAQAEMNARLQEQGLYAQTLDPGTSGFLPGLISAGTTLGAAALLAPKARGAYVDHPTVALIGEKGPEMVVPLSPGHEHMQDIARHALADIRRGKVPHPPSDLERQPDGTLMPHMADGGIVDPGMQWSGYLQRAAMPGSNYIPRGYIDPRSRGEKIGDAIAQGAQTVADIILAKRMGDAAQAKQDQKDIAADKLDRAQHGGYSSDELAKSEDARINYSRWKAQNDIAEQQARDQVYAQHGLDPVTGLPIPRAPQPQAQQPQGNGLRFVGGLPVVPGGGY